MTQPDLARLEGLLTKATKGPWEGEAADDYVITAATYPKEYGGRFKEDSTGFYLATVGNHPSDYGEANRDLIVEAVNALPALLARVRELTEAIENIDCAAAVSHNGTEQRTLSYILEVTKGILDPDRAAPTLNRSETNAG